MWSAMVNLTPRVSNAGNGFILCHVNFQFINNIGGRCKCGSPVLGAP